MPDEDREKTPNIQAPDDVALFGRIVDILEEARSHVARTVNSAMVVAYWLIGREIVEEEQKGQKRADYGKAVIEDLYQPSPALRHPSTSSGRVLRDRLGLRDSPSRGE